jgi:2'-5' RNA ligase
VRPENVHLTLKFLGEVAAGREAEVVTALGKAAQGARAITLAVRGAGAFPNPHRPRVVWAGVEPDPAIEILADQVERHFESLGFPSEGQPFRPHLTVGGGGGGARPRQLTGLKTLIDGIAVEATAVIDGLDLLRSELRRDGSVYHRVHRERLS